MLGFTEKVSDIIQALRVKELMLSTLFRRLLCIRVFFDKLVFVDSNGNVLHSSQICCFYHI